jgi:hypothetical protein
MLAAAGVAWTAVAAAAPPLVDAPGGFVPRSALSFGASGAAAVAVDDEHPLPVAAAGRTVMYSDRSGMIAVAGVAQVLAPASATRRGFFVQNLSTGDLWLNGTGTAVAGSPALRIGPGQLYECPASGVPATALSILGTAAGQTFSAREW